MGGLLPRYQSKSTDLKKVTVSEIEDAIVKLNDKPRKSYSIKRQPN